MVLLSTGGDRAMHIACKSNALNFKLPFPEDSLQRRIVHRRSKDSHLCLLNVASLPQCKQVKTILVVCAKSHSAFSSVH